MSTQRPRTEPCADPIALHRLAQPTIPYLGRLATALDDRGMYDDADRLRVIAQQLEDEKAATPRST